MRARGKIRVSVVIPALNEEKNIQHVVQGIFRSFRQLGLEGEIIAVDDGSVDRTSAILRGLRAANPRLTVLRHERPSGIGGAFLAGARRALGDAVVMIPGDNENRAQDVLKFLDLLNHVDIIVPFVHNSELRDLRRRFLSSWYRLIISFSFGTTLNYYNGTVVYRTRLLRSLQIRSRGFFYQAEILIRALRRGARFAEVPVMLQRRPHGRSKAISPGSFFQVVRDFFALFLDIHIRRVESHGPRFR